MKYFGFDKTLGQLGALRRLGFGQAGIEVDFVAGTYSKDGVSKTFDDLFTFNRAGKAWLVNDSGLQEFAANAPRFDGGLLIEQSATNAISYSSDITRWASDGGTAIKADNIGYTVTQTDTSRGIFSSDPDIVVGQARMLSSYIKKTQTDAYVTLTGRGQYVSRLSATINTKNGVVSRSTEVTDITVVSVGEYYLLRFKTTNGGSPPQLRLAKTDSAGDYVVGDYTVGMVTHSSGTVYSSFILTGATPVTRPADFLSAAVTGTTVTGDWDSTLTLSIVDGQLVHSGYGRIRTLEIK